MALVSSRYEKTWSSSGDPFARAVAKASLEAVGECPEEGRARVLWETGAAVVGPLYLGFCAWLLRQSSRRGLGRLYFMARDGHILKEIADVLEENRPSGIERRYLHVSRQSLLYPSIAGVEPFDARWFMWHPLASYSARKVLTLMEIDPAQAAGELKSLGLRDLDRRLSMAEKWRLRSLFFTPRVRELIKGRARTHYESAAAYFRQEKMGDGSPYAIVDLGWAAQSQYALSRLLDKGGDRPRNGLHGYYLGLNRLVWKYRDDSLESVLFDSTNLSLRIKSVEYSLLEIFTALEQGRTLRYEIGADGLSRPVLDGPNRPAIQWGCKAQRDGIVAFARRFVRNASPETVWSEESFGLARKNYESFCNYPTPSEAEAYGSFSHGADIGEKSTQRIAPKTDAAGFAKILVGYYWVQGSAALSFPRMRGLVVELFAVCNVLRHWLLTAADALFFKTPIRGAE